MRVNSNWVEAVGYLGSALVLVSMLMKSVVRLRVINLTGSLIFSVYALIIRSYPTAVMNIALVGINVYHLLRLRKPARHFDVYEDSPDSAWVRYLLERYREDIAANFPDFSAEGLQAGGERAFVVLEGSEAAGLLIGRPEEDGLRITLDYATPVYRDCSVGRALYAALPGLGAQALSMARVTESHRRYAERNGFETRPDGAALLRLH